MNTTHVNVSIQETPAYQYPIIIGQNILHQIGHEVEYFAKSPRIFLISNTTVYSLYGTLIKESLLKESFQVFDILIPEGEDFKNQQTLQFVYDQMLEARIERKDLILALGGGVVGDIVGYAAATMLRGIRYIQIPTTLLAQVDSSVGGKVAVNHHAGKNLIGAFYQPQMVYTDIDTIKTLPERELLSGLAEVVKYSFIDQSSMLHEPHPGFAHYLKENNLNILSKQPENLEDIISYSCKVKASVVSHDEKELGLRAILNFGHTLGHAIEVCQNYSGYTHGEAVSIGMHYALKLSLNTGFLSLDNYNFGLHLIQLYHLPVYIPRTLILENIFNAMTLDKKIDTGKMKFILTHHTIGKVIIKDDIPREIILKTMGDIYET